MRGCCRAPRAWGSSSWRWSWCVPGCASSRMAMVPAACAELPCHRRACPCRPVCAHARGTDAGAGLAVAGEGAGRDRRQEAQAQPRDPCRGHARRRGVLPAHERARARQGRARFSGRADERHHGQCLAQDPGGAPGRRALRARQRSRAPAPAHDPQPLPGPRHALAGVGRGLAMAGPPGGTRAPRCEGPKCDSWRCRPPVDGLAMPWP